MSTKERLRREPLERTGPRRSFFEFWVPGSPQWNGSTNGGGEQGDERNPVAQAVRMAYQVADEQIALGQRVASQINDEAYDFNGAGDDLQEMTKRFWRFGQDFVTLWFDAASRFPGAARGAPPEGAEGASGANGARPSGPANSRPRAQGADPTVGRSHTHDPVLVEIASRQKARVSVDLWGGGPGEELKTHGVRSLDPAVPPIVDVVYAPAAGKEPATLCVTVPDDQPAGDYTGVLLNNSGNDVVGSLVVRITA